MSQEYVKKFSILLHHHHHHHHHHAFEVCGFRDGDWTCPTADHSRLFHSSLSPAWLIDSPQVRRSSVITSFKAFLGLASPLLPARFWHLFVHDTLLIILVCCIWVYCQDSRCWDPWRALLWWHAPLPEPHIPSAAFLLSTDQCIISLQLCSKVYIPLPKQCFFLFSKWRN